MLLPRALLDSQHGLFTYRQALAAGIDQRQLNQWLRAGLISRLRRGVYVLTETWQALDSFRGQPLLLVRAAHLTLQVPHVFSHDSSALVLGMGISHRAPLVHVTREKVHGDRQRAGIKHHLAPYHAGQVAVHDGLEVLSAARTALDLAREHGLGAGVAACDEVLRSGVPRASLRAVAAPMSCWPGIRTVRRAMDLADPGAETYVESLGRVLVHELGIGWPETQFGLTDGHRTVWCDIRVGRHVFEVDGQLKYRVGNMSGLAPEEVLWREKQRQDFIAGFKLGVSRITTSDLFSGRRAALDRLLREYRSTVDRYGHDIADLAPYVVRGRAPFPHM